MNEKSQVQTMLTDLADHAPPVDIDVDHAIVLGRRGARRRRTGALLMAAAGVSVVIATGVTLAPQALNLDPAGPTPSSSSSTMTLEGDGSTPQSRALLAEIRELVPELAAAGKSLHAIDVGWRTSDGKPVRRQTAFLSWYDPSTQRTRYLTISVSKGAATAMPPYVCMREPKESRGRCTLGATQIDVGGYTIMWAKDMVSEEFTRPDGSAVSILSFSTPEGSPLLTDERAREVARQITVEP